MVTSCSALDCPSKLRYSNIRFMKFPLNNPILLEKWLKAINRTDFVPTKASVLCYMHFRREDFHFRRRTYQLDLNRNAVPFLSLNIPPKNKLKVINTVTQSSPKVENIEMTEDQELPTDTVYIEIVEQNGHKTKPSVTDDNVSPQLKYFRKALEESCSNLFLEG